MLHQAGVPAQIAPLLLTMREWQVALGANLPLLAIAGILVLLALILTP